MKQGSIKGFISGVLVTTLVLGLGLPALASTLKTAELYYNNIQIRLNGEPITPKDAKGNAVEPFSIDGTTYLPIRAIGEALGLTVSYDGKTSTVILGNDPAMDQPAAWLGDLEPFEGAHEEKKVTTQQYDDYSTANSGDTYDRYYRLTRNEGASYLLKGQYARLTGDFYLIKNMKDTTNQHRMLVYADDRLIYTSPTVTVGVEPVAINVDLENCYKMKLVWQVSRDDGETWTNFGSGAPWGTHLGNPALWTD